MPSLTVVTLLLMYGNISMKLDGIDTMKQGDAY